MTQQYLQCFIITDTIQVIRDMIWIRLVEQKQNHVSIVFFILDFESCWHDVRFRCDRKFVWKFDDHQQCKDDCWNRDESLERNRQRHDGKQCCQVYTMLPSVHNVNYRIMMPTSWPRFTHALIAQFSLHIYVRITKLQKSFMLGSL